MTKMEKEKILLAQIHKQDGKITMEFPNERDILAYELYGFLHIYLQKLEEELFFSMFPIGDDE